jgi:predicted RNA-binding protein with PUA-like domain
VTLEAIKENTTLRKMKLVQKVSRLSIMPVVREGFDGIVRI